MITINIDGTDQTGEQYRFGFFEAFQDNSIDNNIINSIKNNKYIFSCIMDRFIRDDVQTMKTGKILDVLNVYDKLKPKISKFFCIFKFLDLCSFDIKLDLDDYSFLSDAELEFLLAYLNSNKEFFLLQAINNLINEYITQNKFHNLDYLYLTIITNSKLNFIIFSKTSSEHFFNFISKNSCTRHLFEEYELETLKWLHIYYNEDVESIEKYPESKISDFMLKKSTNEYFSRLFKKASEMKSNCIFYSRIPLDILNQFFLSNEEKIIIKGSTSEIINLYKQTDNRYLATWILAYSNYSKSNFFKNVTINSSKILLPTEELNCNMDYLVPLFKILFNSTNVTIEQQCALKYFMFPEKNYKKYILYYKNFDFSNVLENDNFFIVFANSLYVKYKKLVENYTTYYIKYGSDISKSIIKVTSKFNIIPQTKPLSLIEIELDYINKNNLKIEYIGIQDNLLVIEPHGLIPVLKSASISFLIKFGKQDLAYFTDGKKEIIVLIANNKIKIYNADNMLSLFRKNMYTTVNLLDYIFNMNRDSDIVILNPKSRQAHYDSDQDYSDND